MARFSPQPSFSTREFDYLIEYKVLTVEDITISAGTFKAFKIEINHTNYDAKMASGKAYIWYSPEIKLFTKITFDGSSYWKGSTNSELLSFNLKEKGIFPKKKPMFLNKSYRLSLKSNWYLHLPHPPQAHT